MRKLKGSFSIEAALITPLLMFLFAAAMNGGLTLHEETRELCLQIAEQEKMNVVESLYRIDGIGEILGKINEN